MVAYSDPAASISRQFFGEYFLGLEGEIEFCRGHELHGQ
jgi:hypothetical protein